MPKINGKQLKQRLELIDLSEQQQRFVLEYMLGDGVPWKAAKAAGYKQPSVAAHQLLKNKKIAALILRCQRERAGRAKVSADRILEELDMLAMRDPIDLCDEFGMIVVSDLRQIPERMRRCIDGIEVESWVDGDGNSCQKVKFKLVPKLLALELSMKARGMLTEKKSVDVKAGINWDTLLGGLGKGQASNVIETDAASMDQRILEEPKSKKSNLLTGIPAPQPGAADYAVDELAGESHDEEAQDE